MTEFEKWNEIFQNNEMSSFNGNQNGLLWLKVRAISRKKTLQQFVNEIDIVLTKSKVAEMTIELYNILLNRDDLTVRLDEFLMDRSKEWYNQKGVDIKQLKEDLYKIHNYSWGGDQNNSLDKYLIRHYVKNLNKYDELQNRHQEIGQNAWDYVQNSWYNNWTSFIIESLFKQNPKVIPAIGEIKSVDFFINGFPIDLKVTFFPNKFMEHKLKNKLGKSTLTCRSVRIKIFLMTKRLPLTSNYIL